MGVADILHCTVLPADTLLMRNNAEVSCQQQCCEVLEGSNLQAALLCSACRIRNLVERCSAAEMYKIVLPVD